MSKQTQSRSKQGFFLYATDFGQLPEVPRHLVYTLMYLIARCQKYGYCFESFKSINRNLGCARSTMYLHFKQLEALGIIERFWNERRQRCIRITKGFESMARERIPRLGVLPAETPPPQGTPREMEPPKGMSPKTRPPPRSPPTSRLALALRQISASKRLDFESLAQTALRELGVDEARLLNVVAWLAVGCPGHGNKGYWRVRGRDVATLVRRADDLGVGLRGLIEDCVYAMGRLNNLERELVNKRIDLWVADLV